MGMFSERSCALYVCGCFYITFACLSTASAGFTKDGSKLLLVAIACIVFVGFIWVGMWVQQLWAKLSTSRSMAHSCSPMRVCHFWGLNGLGMSTAHMVSDVLGWHKLCITAKSLISMSNSLYQWLPANIIQHKWTRARFSSPFYFFFDWNRRRILCLSTRGSTAFPDKERLTYCSLFTHYYPRMITKRTVMVAWTNS